jgi:hypothetical protein
MNPSCEFRADLNSDSDRTRTPIRGQQSAVLRGQARARRQREWTDRDNLRVTRRIKEARLGASASLEAVDCDPARGLDKAMVRQLMTCQWTKQSP